MLAALPLASQAADTWIPVKDTSLVIDTGSTLDFSALAPVRKTITEQLVVTPSGDFAFSGSPTVPRRFLMASTGFDPATGSFPDKPAIDTYVNQLRIRGYSMIRLHFVDSILMTNRLADFDFDPVQLDRFYYLLAAMKSAGIYYMVDGLTSGNAGYGNIKERWVDSKLTKVRVFYNAEAQAHWRTLVTKIFGSVNPYTGKTTLQDPALAGLILVNEGGLPFVTRDWQPAELVPLFNNWLKTKYVTTAALKTAWGAELGAAETLEAKNVALAGSYSGVSRRMSDSQQFYVSVEKSTADWMIAHVRAAGYTGLVTGYDNWLSPGAHASRSQFNWVDIHSYFSEPTHFIDVGSIIKQDSMLSNWATYIADMALSRQSGKAFSVSEYGQVFWNKYRRESALAVPAYAAFQNWGIISQHTGAFTLSYADTSDRKNRITPYMVGPDPILRANETLAALLYTRGDVATAKKRLGLKLDPNFSFDQNSFLGVVPSNVRRLGIVSGVSVDWMGTQAAAYDAQMNPAGSGLTIAGVPTPTLDPTLQSKTGVYDNDVFNNRITVLRLNAMLAKDARYNTADGIYQTDTGEITLETPRKRLVVKTPRTEGVVFDIPEALTIGSLRVESATGGALVSASSLDNLPLSSSKRMLLIMASDARNTGMLFQDTAETKLAAVGSAPVTILSRAVTLTLTNVNAARLKVYSNTLRGSRGDAIPVTVSGSSITFTLDNAKLSHGPTTYFEVVYE
jgi:hypothetical protein